MKEDKRSASPDAEQPVRRGRGRPKLRSDIEISNDIVEKAMDRMIRDGYGATRVDDIAADSGISKRTLYRLFASKQDLFSAMVVLHGRWMMDIPDETDESPLEDQLGRVLRVDLDPALEVRRMRFLDFAISESRQYPELGEILRAQGGEKARSALTGFFTRLAASGRLGTLQPDRAAGMLMDLAYGALPLKTGKGGEWPGGDDRQTYLRSCIRFFINGIGSV